MEYRKAILSFIMTGTAHSKAYKEHRDSIKSGDYLSFELDQNNAYDRDAIKVLWNGLHIGWVPKRLADAKSMLTRLCEAEEEIEGMEFTIQCRVESHEPNNPTDMQLIAMVELLLEYASE